MSYFDEVYERIKEAIDVKTQMELANALDIKQSSISDAKKRRAIPSEWLIKLYDRESLNPDWLRWGVGPVRLNKQDEGWKSSPLPWKTGALDKLPDSFGRQDIADRPLVMAEEGARSLPLAREGNVPVFSPACEYEDGGPKPVFATLEYISLPQSYVGKGILVFQTESNNMEPTLRKGGYVGVASASRPLISGEIYAVLAPYEGVVFRRILQDSEEGFYLLCFEQDVLPGKRLSVQTLKDRLIGKVLWSLQSV